jgi:hypothetical protein
MSAQQPVKGKKNTERRKRRSGARGGYIEEEQGDSPGGLFHASSPIGFSLCELPAAFRSLSIH